MYGERTVNAKGSKINLQITTYDVQHLLPRQVALKVSNAHQQQRLVWATKQFFAIVIYLFKLRDFAIC